MYLGTHNNLLVLTYISLSVPISVVMCDWVYTYQPCITNKHKKPIFSSLLHHLINICTNKTNTTNAEFIGLSSEF